MLVDQEYFGDYGYDLAHEMNAGLHDIPRPRSASQVVPSRAPFAVDLNGDLGYDSAHEGSS
jgi:hypothetical protein